VDHLLEDAAAGKLPQPSESGFERLLAERGVQPVDYAGWQRIDEYERARGSERGRPRVKLTSIGELVERSRE
jgi:ferredoxin--NADP+ reductase